MTRRESPASRSRESRPLRTCAHAHRHTPHIPRVTHSTLHTLRVRSSDTHTQDRSPPSIHRGRASSQAEWAASQGCTSTCFAVRRLSASCWSSSRTWVGVGVGGGRPGGGRGRPQGAARMVGGTTRAGRVAMPVSVASERLSLVTVSLSRCACVHVRLSRLCCRHTALRNGGV